VKYRVMMERGAVTVQTRSSWNDRHGTHHRHHDPGDYDSVAIYCPDTDECYYLLASELAASGRTLRITSPANNQVTGVCLANLFADPCRLFDPVCQLGEEQVGFRTSAVATVANLSAATGAAHCCLFDARPGQESNPQSAI
jgi:PD-(D/E)XK nuclease superfamily protein